MGYQSEASCSPTSSPPGTLERGRTKTPTRMLRSGTSAAETLRSVMSDGAPSVVGGRPQGHEKSFLWNWRSSLRDQVPASDEMDSTASVMSPASPPVYLAPSPGRSTKSLIDATAQNGLAHVNWVVEKDCVEKEQKIWFRNSESLKDQLSVSRGTILQLTRKLRNATDDAASQHQIAAQAVKTLREQEAKFAHAAEEAEAALRKERDWSQRRFADLTDQLGQAKASLQREIEALHVANKELQRRSSERTVQGAVFSAALCEVDAVLVAENKAADARELALQNALLEAVLGRDEVMKLSTSQGVRIRELEAHAVRCEAKWASERLAAQHHSQRLAEEVARLREALAVGPHVPCPAWVLPLDSQSPIGKPAPSAIVYCRPSYKPVGGHEAMRMRSTLPRTV